jgi:hypothetical protein
MRYLIALLFVLASCVSPDPAHYGTKTVATNLCREPQATYARNVENLNMLGLSAWHLRTDLASTLDVEIECNDFTSDCMDFHISAACGPQAGYYTLGSFAVHIDPARANGEFAFSGVANHELIHWYIYNGPHPERARMHICECGVAAPECWPGDCGHNNLMSPVLAGLGTSTMSSWNGDLESADVGEITQNFPTEMDRRFVLWAITP